MRVLLVEDEPEMSQLIAARVRAAGYSVDRVATLADAEAAAGASCYALFLIDRRLPDGDGASIIPRLRHASPDAGVMLVSALDAVQDRVAGLDAGADDYLTKPFNADELLARMRTVLRRMAGAPLITVGHLTYDVARREAAVHGVPLILRRRELSVLEALVRRAGRVVQRETLLGATFGYDDEVQSNTLDAHVSRLRARLASAGAKVVIHPVRGVGYLLEAA
jgi:two-component system OmpR family response regulator